MRILLLAVIAFLSFQPARSAVAERPSKCRTSLRVEVAGAVTGLPLPGSVVTVSGGPSAVTRADGTATITGLWSASPHRTVDVTVRSGGYDLAVWKGIRLWDNDTTIVPFRMTRTGRLQVNEEPQHGLEVEKRLRDPVEAFTPSESGGGIQAALGPEPLYIRVWRVAKSTAAGYDIVENILFEDYVKGVVPKEWYTSWHAESLKSGCVAARTYGWYYALHPKYPSKNADVSDTTASQVYSETRVASTNTAADASRSQALTYNGAIISAEYSAENSDPTTYGGVPYKPSVADPVCAGQTLYGHGRGLCQWGSQRWAIGAAGSDGAKTYDWILSHYYSSATLLQVAGGGLDVGDCAAVEGGTATIRSSPSGSTIATVTSGTLVHIIGGPQVYGGLTYWQVEWPLPTPTASNGWMTGQMLVETSCPTMGVAISGISVSSITGTSATIRWTTNVPATTVVHYGVQSSSLNLTGTGPISTAHEVILTGLTPSTTWYYTVESGAAGMLTNITPVYSFITASPPPPITISGFTVQTLGETTATLFWQTDQPTDTTLVYGLSTDTMNQTATGMANTVFHSVDLTDLVPDTTYYAQARSTASGFSDGLSSVLAVHTNAPIVLSNIAAGNIQTDGAAISWTLNAPQPVTVSYGTASGALEMSDSVPAGVTSLDLYGLQPDTRYFYQLFVSAQGHASVSSPEMSFRTDNYGTVALGSVTVSGITASGATLSWECRPEGTGTVRYGLSAGPPYAFTASDASGTAHNVTLQNLPAGTPIHYSVESGATGYLSGVSPDAVFTTLSLKGDVDNNGVVNFTDAVIALQIALGGTAADGGVVSRGDVAAPVDGTVQLEDGLVILRVAAGLQTLP